MTNASVKIAPRFASCVMALHAAFQLTRLPRSGMQNLRTARSFASVSVAARGTRHEEAAISVQKAARNLFGADAADTMAEQILQLARPVEQRPAWSPARNKIRGLFYVFEGLDRSGKTTHSRKLVDKLAKKTEVTWMCFPNRETATGLLIDSYLTRKAVLSDDAIHLLFAANRWEKMLSVVDDLHNGKSVVCDRYAFSGVAYSVAKGMDASWCKEADVGLPSPDCVFFLRVDEEVAAKRVDYGSQRYEEVHMQGRVRRAFEAASLRRGIRWFDIDSLRTVEVNQAEIQTIAEQIRRDLETADDASIDRLWVSHESDKQT